MIRKGVSAIVLNKKGEVLLVQRHDLRTWVFPGGHINEGEKPQQAIRREVKEETGVEIKIEGLALITLRDHPLFKGISLAFLAKKIGGKEKIQKGEIIALRWVKKQYLDKFLSPKYYQRFLDVSLNDDKSIKLIVDHQFPLAFRKLPLFIWRRTLGKNFS